MKCEREEGCRDGHHDNEGDEKLSSSVYVFDDPQDMKEHLSSPHSRTRDDRKGQKQVSGNDNVRHQQYMFLVINVLFYLLILT